MSIGMRPLLMLCLMGLFLVFFGLPAIRRFEEEKVIVITSKKKTGGIEAPAISVTVRNLETRFGWRNATSADLYNIETICNSSTSQDMENCIVQSTNDQNEMIKDVILGFNTKKSLMNFTLPSIWTEDMPATWSGPTYTMNVPIKIGPDYLIDQIFVVLGKHVHLRIFIHDPCFFVTTRNPNYPFNYIKIDNPKTTQSHLYRLALTEVQELDVRDDPCNSEHDYNFKVG